MKRFCSQCGKELGKNILICPKCGFKNKKDKNKKRLLLLMIILVPLITLGGLGYIFRNQIITIVKNPLDFISSIKDPDYEKETDFKETYEKYLLELDYYTSTLGYPLNKENSNDFEPTIGGNVDSKMYDLLTLRETKLEQIEDNNCYVQMNANDLCDKIRKELRAINEDISRQVSFRASESRYCGMKDDDEFITTCQKALDWNYHYGDRDCKSCNDIIQKLLTISSSMGNESLSADLLTLTSVLEEYNELVLARVKAMRESYSNDIPMAFNRDRIRLVESLSNAELQKEYSKEEYKIEKSLLLGKPLTKENLIEHYYSIMDSLLGSINETEEMIDNYSSTIEELEKEITSYTSVVNGAYQLNLSSPK